MLRQLKVKYDKQPLTIRAAIIGAAVSIGLFIFEQIFDVLGKEDEAIQAKFTVTASSIYAPATFEMDASDSRDPLGQPLRYEWFINNEQIMSNYDKQYGQFYLDEAGRYEIKLRVSAGSRHNEYRDQVVVQPSESKEPYKIRRKSSTRLLLVPDSTGNGYELRTDFSIEINNQRITVPKGFRTHGAGAIPPEGGITPYNPRTITAFTVFNWLTYVKLFSKDQTSEILYNLLRKAGISTLRANVYYAAVAAIPNDLWENDEYDWDYLVRLCYKVGCDLDNSVYRFPSEVIAPAAEKRASANASLFGDG